MKHLLLTTIAAVVLVGCRGKVQQATTVNPEADVALLSAAYDGNIEVARQQLAEGADVNVKDRDYRNETPLQYAAKEGHTKVVELLIANGADVNAISVYGAPLDEAVERDETEIAELLRKNGAKTSEELKAEGK